MKPEELRKILRYKKELDWCEFKKELKLYSDGKLKNHKLRDELTKDILGLANGNCNIIRNTKYLIVGVSDTEFDENGARILTDVDYRVPSTDELGQIINGRTGNAVIGIESQIITLDDCRIWVVTIPPSFQLHETTKELKADGQFAKHTVFMRKGTSTEPASHTDSAAISELKSKFRRGQLTPNVLLIGSVVPGFIGVSIWDAQSQNQDSGFWSDFGGDVIIFLFTSFFGLLLTYGAISLSGIMYELRFMSRKEKVIKTTILIVIFSIYLIFKS